MPSNMDMTGDEAFSTVIITDKDGNEIHVGDDVKNGTPKEDLKDEPGDKKSEENKNPQDNS